MWQYIEEQVPVCGPVSLVHVPVGFVESKYTSRMLGSGVSMVPLVWDVFAW
jgi:hypothetical protein